MEKTATPGLGFRALQEIFGRHRVELKREEFDRFYVLSLESTPPDEAKSDSMSDLKAIGATYEEAEKIHRDFSASMVFDPNFEATKNFLDGGYAIGANNGITQNIKRHYRGDQAWVDVKFSAHLLEEKCQEAKNLAQRIGKEHVSEWPDPEWVERDAFKNLKPYNTSECVALKDATGVRWHIVDMEDGSEAFQASVDLGNESSRAAYQLGEAFKNIEKDFAAKAVMDATKTADGKITIPSDLITEEMNPKIAAIDDKKLKSAFASPDGQQQSQVPPR